ncbi:fasciclin-1-like [Mytilus trossulus]|uniref:fasciclin-1-like n=1 Tax=Mytilus trossulus TaxID=6551 RepID=UPI003004D952
MRIFVKYALLGILLNFNGVLLDNLYTKSKTVVELISETNRLRQVSTMIEDTGLSLFFEQSHITAFIPTTEALLTFDEKKYGYDLTDRETVRSLLLYHMVKGTYLDSELPAAKEARSLHPSGYKLYFNQFTEGSEKIFTVNGAVLITSNITASNGVLHIIDRVMAPIASAKTVHDYILYPEIHSYSFSSINNASIVDLDLRQWTTDTNRKFTVFLPNDGHLVSMPKYGQDRLFTDWYLIRKIYHAHTVLDTFSFIPSKGEIPKLTSMQGDITFHRENNRVYIKSNRVKALVIQANVPTVNGIIHVIDNLLYFIYMNIVQTIQKLPNTQTFKLYLERHSQVRSYLGSLNGTKTVFVPTDTAFAKLPSNKQQQFTNDLTYLSQILNNHILSSEVDETSLVDGQTFTTLSNKTITVIRKDKTFYLETEDMQIQVEETDIGCTNGIIHLIDNVILRKDYTVWDAITGNDQLIKMKSFMQKYNDLPALMNNAGVHVTVFLPFDYVMDDIPGSTLSSFSTNPDLLYDALSGHIILGHTLATFNMSSKETFNTYGGHQLTTVYSKEEISVTGSYITAGVIVRDILCSNGVIHIIDNLMHVATRNILDEMKRHKEISVVSSFIGLYTMQMLQNLLSDKDEDITIFVPVNDAFNDIPRSRADKLLMDSLLLERILQAHVVTSGSHLVEQLYAKQNLISVEDTIYIRKSNNTVGLVSNNVHSRITTSNVMATNGVIHMVDRLLYYPYFTVAETMSKDERLIPFFDMMFENEDFQDLSDASDEDMTVFVPSPSSLANITTNPSILTQLYLGHVLPGLKIDEKYLNKQKSKSAVNVTENNITFSMTNQTIGYSIDVGYSNLRYYFNIISDGIACSNGIVYMIDGLLNFNNKTLIQEIQSDSSYLHAFNYMLRFWPSDSGDKLRQPDRNFTIFLPAAFVVDSLSKAAVDFLDSITEQEKEEFYARHVIEEHVLIVKDISQGWTMKNNVTAEYIDNEMSLNWNNTHSRILHANVLSSNGLIHIIDKLFIDLPETPTTVSPKGTTKKSSHTNCSESVLIFHSFYAIILTIFVILLT